MVDKHRILTPLKYHFCTYLHIFVSRQKLQKHAEFLKNAYVTNFLYVCVLFEV